MSRRIRFVVRGRVQGVAFRASTRAVAERIRVTGFVRNRVDGAVDGEAQGPPDAIDAFVAFLEDGPPWARVDEIAIDDAPLVPDETGFVILR